MSADIAALSVQACPGPPLHWLEIELVDQHGVPVAAEEYVVTLPSGAIVRGFLDATGCARLSGIKQPGNCAVSFPSLDAAAWKPQAG